MTIRIEPIFDADVVICGAGPAGAAAATHLARRGIDVLLIDRQAFPRDKVCGDFVGPVALQELNALGVGKNADFQHANVIREAALFLNGTELISQAIPVVPKLPSFGRCVPRSLLDMLILQEARAAGARVLEQYRTTGFAVSSSGVKVMLEGPKSNRQLHTRLLIGADGSNSLVARLLRKQRPSDQDRIIAVRSYFEQVEGPEDRADLFFTAECFPGYYWLFPTGRHTANVGIGMMLETVPPAQDRLKSLLLQLIRDDAALRHRLRHSKMSSPIIGWPLTTYNPSAAIVGDRVILVGDAAGLINPLNGEGIQYALLSARWAADVVANCAKERDFSSAALASYSQRVQTELRFDMALAGLVVHFIRNRSLNPVWLKVLTIITARARRDLDYAHIVGGILAGLVPASDALSTKVLLRTFEQAAVSTGADTLLNMIRGPSRWAGLGKEALRSVSAMCLQTAGHPVTFLKWGAGLAAGTMELATQAAGHWMEQYVPPGHRSFSTLENQSTTDPARSCTSRSPQ